MPAGYSLFRLHILSNGTVADLQLAVPVGDVPMALSTTAPPDHFDTEKQMSLSFEASFFSMKEDLGTYIISTMNIGDKDIPGRCCVPCWCVKI